MAFNENWAIRLTAIMGVVFVLQAMFPWVTEIFVLGSRTVLFEPWTLVTSIFLHGGLEHILFNGFALVLFGTILESIIGSRKFLMYFLVTGVAAGIVFILGIPVVQAVQGSTATAALGASGAIFGILGVLTVLRPNMVVYLGFFPMPMWLPAIIWAAQGFFGIFIPDNVANFAHLGGLFLGLLIGLSITNWKIGVAGKRPSEKVIREDDMSRWERDWM